ncbi:gamma-tubulin complex component 6 isoform X1 [Clupea harengus]|uniref:Gamma-tubulin complex component 6 n=1 Tax=Clupea harengus TaxID=7950 RepID=A0A6P3W9H5_CLUHA|nr:gamma-tubulin complex component 6 isoform X1 [Clupea harengus]
MSSCQRINNNNCNSSITELVGALCDSSLTGVSWKRRALGSISREGVQRALRRRAYGALLSKLFQDSSPKPPSPLASTPPRNKMLMISFDLRVCGCPEEAERLEELLGMLKNGPASGLAELDSVLELLFQLAGSVPPPPTSFSKDYMRRDRPVLRRIPLGGYQSEELQRLEARAWALVCGEEWGNLGGLCGSLGLMDALPGTGLLALRQSTEVEERFERDTRLSLFGALQHSRTTDLDVKLDLPPVPSNADLTGLAIRVPPYLDQSEDEGFQSASNLTPDSQSEPSLSPEVDMWEALRTFEPGKRRCWESIGCPPGQKVAPYLTEAGRVAFDQLYRLWEGEIRLVSCTQTPSPLPPLPLDSQTQLVKDLLNVLIGVASTTFPLNQDCVQFDVRFGVCLSGASPESMSRLLSGLALYGTHYLRLSRFSLQSAHKRGLVFQAFAGGLRRYLHYYRACVLSTPLTFSLLTISFLFRKLGSQLRYLSELCCVDAESSGGQATFPAGVKLLSYLYNEAQSNSSNENYPVLLSLLKSSCEPYTRFVSDWVYSGVFRDVYGEFMIQVNEDCLSFRDKHFWTQGYTLISNNVEDCVPVFLRHIASDVYVCGKTINLLKICCPQHYICGSDVPVPRIAVTFSLQEVEEVERDCAIYRGRMERIAKHSAISREEQALRTEQARQELINQVRESAAKTLESIRGLQVSQRLLEEAKKRERFDEMKQQLELEQEWRSTAKAKEQQDDFGFARELRDREKRLQALEEQLEERARKELIAQYSRLSEEAAKRERKAMWRVQRMRLDGQRDSFLQQDQQHIQALLEKCPLGQPGPSLEVFSRPGPALRTAQESPGAEPQAEQIGAGGVSLTRPPPPPVSISISVPATLASVTTADISDGSQRVDRALQDIGSDLPADPASAPHPPPPPPPSSSSLPLADYDFNAPFVPLEDGVHIRPRWDTHPSLSHVHLKEDGTAEGQEGEEGREGNVPASKQTDAELPESAQEPNTVTGDIRQDKQSECPLSRGGDNTSELSAGPIHGHPSDAHIKVGENISDVVDAVSFPSGHGHTSDAHIRVGENVSEVQSSLPTANIHGHASDAHIRVGENVSEVQSSLPTANIHGHASDAHIRVGENVSEVQSSLPTANIHGHASDAHIRVGENVSEVIDALPSQSVHGHTSDAHIKVGGNVSEVEAPLPTSDIHGHASDAHIRVGEIVSKVITVLPSASVHGHASDAHITVGKNVSEVDAPLASQNVHGHSSDANMQVGGFVSDVTSSEPRWSEHGHASDATLGIGCVVGGTEVIHSLPSTHGHSSDCTLVVGCVVAGVEPLPSPLPGCAHGHSSDSTLGGGCIVSGIEPQLAPLPGSAYGHSSDSTLGGGCQVSGIEPQMGPLPGSAHGHSSDSTLGGGCMVSGIQPKLPPLPGSAYGHSSDSTLGGGCMVSGIEPQMGPLPGSAYGHSSDSTLGGGCMVSGVEPLPSPLPGSAHGHSSDSTLGGGCMVSGSEPHLVPLPGSAYGHSSDSTLGVGCVVKGPKPGSALQKGDGDAPSTDLQNNQDSGYGLIGLPAFLDEGLTAWAQGLGLSPGESPEDDYLLSLASQYEVEQYQDTYNIMTSVSDAQPLQQVMRGPYGLRMDPSLHRATDTTAVRLSQMVSLPVLMKHSVTTPLITHVSLVNKAVVDYFFVELGVERHFEALRHFLLMEDGEFAQSLSDLLFEKLGSGQTPGELLTPLVLNSILNKALQYSLHGDSALAANFTFALRYLPETFHPHAPDSLNCLELRYKVDWPLNIIITDSCMNKYNRLFSFLLQLKHMVWTLRDVWFQLKRTARVKGVGGSVQFHQLQLYRHEMQHFVKVIQGYLANQILQVSWSEFTTKLGSVSDLDAIHRTHADYLNRAIFRGLLTEKAAPVMNIIHSIFSLILKFRAQLISQPWDCQQGEAVHPSFIAMQQSYNTFKYYSHFLFTVVSKLVNKGYQPHLEDFLLRINFNDYYKDS